MGGSLLCRAVKISFFSIFWSLTIFDSFTNSSMVYDFTHSFSPAARRFASVSHFIFDGIYSTWMLVVVVISARCIDVTEEYKIYVYTAVSAGALLAVIAAKLLSDHIAFFRDTSLSFVVPFSIQNFFALLMVVFHWPFELITDQQYQGTEDSVSPRELLGALDELIDTA
jgi:hypothetical protein